MKHNAHCFANLTAASLSLLLFSSIFMQPAFAAKTLKSTNEPFQVKLETALDSRLTEDGSPFEAVLEEDYEYKEGIIPSGTRFKGNVSKSQESRRLLRPGYLVLNVQEVVFPSGETHQLSLVKGVGAQGQKITHHRAKTVMKFAKDSLPLYLAYYGAWVPLTFGTNLGALVVTPIDVGARMAAGAVHEVIRNDDPTKSVAQKVGYGVYRGTGIPGALGVFKTDKEAHFDVGANIPLKLEPDAVNGLFVLRSIVHKDLPSIDAKADIKTVQQFSPEIKDTEYTDLSPIPPAAAPNESSAD